MSSSSTTSTTATRLSPQGLRTLGYAIALASMTGLLAYGCEKGESQKQPAPVAAQPKPAETKPGATTPVAPMPGAQPTKAPAADPAKPVEIGANMVQGEKPAPGKAPEEQQTVFAKSGGKSLWTAASASIGAFARQYGQDFCLPT